MDSNDWSGLSGGQRIRTDLTSFKLIPPPGDARRIAGILILVLLAVGASLLFVPWVQTVSGQGKVIALGPSERSQTLQSVLKGQVKGWMVSEGDRVVRGQPLVEIADLDPELSRRLTTQLDFLSDKITAQTSQIEHLDAQVEALYIVRDQAIAAQTAYVRQARQKQTAAEQKLTAAQNSREVARIQRERIHRLQEEGLASKRDEDLAVNSDQKAEAELRAAETGLRAAEQRVDAALASLGQKRSEIDAKIQDIRAKQQKVRSERADAETKQLEQDIKIARQGDRVIKAPRSGTLFKILAFEGPAVVKVGDPLAILVPDNHSRAVELWVDGNDAAWIDSGRDVRVQFEGWPAIQFGGWPGASVGTFAGVVSFVDATDDGKGNFRILVLPDEEHAPWPDLTLLRQGVRAKGWVLLDTVPLGYEAWRRINGFPPETAARKVPKLPKIKL